jgi:pimeloyl-ACP methyl ester carboxylesterase
MPAMGVEWAAFEIRDVGVGVDLEIVQAGMGATTVLVVPGFGGGIRAYDAFLRALADEYHVLGLSVRGFGRSAWAAPYSIGDWVADVVGVVRDATRTPVVAIGHSFGAYLALAAAAQEPSRFRAVVSLDQILDLAVFVPLARHLNGYWQQVRLAVIEAAGDTDELAASLAEVIALDGRLGDTRSVDELRETAQLWSTQDPAVLDSLTDERSDEWMRDPQITDLPRRVSCPVFFVDGDPEAGSIVSAEMAAGNLASFAGSRQVRLDGVGHQLGLDNTPERVVDAIRPLLAQLG